MEDASPSRAGDPWLPCRSAGTIGPVGTDRRQILAAGGSLVALGVDGCLGTGGDGTTPAPETVAADWTCEVCGMVITAQPGPTAEIFYVDHRPGPHDNPARFCSTWEAFQYDFDREWARAAFYVTDYSSVSYDVYQSGGDQLLTHHTKAGDFTAASGVTFVVDSAVKGAMGADLIGFSAAADADSFVASYGGEVVPFAAVTRDTIAALGR